MRPSNKVVSILLVALQFVGTVAQQIHKRVNNFVFLPKQNYRIGMHAGVTPSPLGLLKSTSTIEFQQVMPPSLTHFHTPDWVIAFNYKKPLLT